MSFRQPLIAASHKGISTLLLSEFISASTYQTTSQGTSFVINTPSGAQSGDVLVLGVIVGNDVINTPSGWTLLQDGLIGGTSSRTAVYSITLSSSPPASYTITFQSSTSPQAIMACYRNALIGGSAESINAASTNITAPTVTTTQDNQILACFFARDDNTAAITLPGSMTQRASVAGGTFSGTERKLILADERISTAGATGTRVATSSGSTASYGVSIFL